MKINQFYIVGLLLLFIFTGCKDKNKSSSIDKNETESVQSSEIKEKHIPPFFQKISGDSARIVPGKSIGNLHVGDEPEQIFKRLGSPDKGEAGMCKSLSRWFYGEETPRRSITLFSECDPNDDMRPHLLWI